ncbi:hypothetical protein [Paenirhodobacter populi]|uniref:hypothetical protein n=1 Tax=Paenirhodobacter populi TaxID=2306993 RepID=UPI000FE3577C|nr:hypothetical protein [Sinirhodobacter populi]RWR09699.1 hypothetical protein D2T32_04975 [Sinirhodobacter populi]
MAGAVITEACARIAAAFPTWLDATGEPSPPPAGRLPWFAVRLSLDNAVPVAMGDGRAMRTGDLAVSFAFRQPRTGNPEAVAQDLATAVAACLTAAPADLGGAVWSILPGGVETDHETGDVRISRADLTFAIQIVG